MANRELTLIIKGMHYPYSSTEGRPDKSTALGQLISHGKQADISLPASNDSLLFDLFGLEIENGQDIPVAAVTRLLDLGVVDKSWWLRADPVHLAPGRSGLIMLANQELELSSTESETLVEEITRAILDEGWILKAPNPHRWYLKPAEPPRITTTPLDVVMQQDIEPFLPAGEDAKLWHTKLNEIQILLHTSQVNVDREASDKLAANSVWFWGGGALPQLKSSPWAAIWSDDVVSLALARLSATEHKKVPRSLDSWLQEAKEGKHLLVIDRFQGSVEDFENQWSAPLQTALKAMELDKLTMYFGTNKCVVVTPSNIRSRWSWRFPFGR